MTDAETESSWTLSPAPIERELFCTPTPSPIEAFGRSPILSAPPAVADRLPLAPTWMDAVGEIRIDKLPLAFNAADADALGRAKPRELVIFTPNAPDAFACNPAEPEIWGKPTEREALSVIPAVMLPDPDN